MPNRCVLCDEREATDRCGPLPERRFCKTCHANKRLVTPCDCMTIMAALRDTSNDAGVTMKRVSELGLVSDSAPAAVPVSGRVSRLTKSEEDQLLEAEKLAIRSVTTRLRGGIPGHDGRPLPPLDENAAVERATSHVRVDVTTKKEGPAMASKKKDKDNGQPSLIESPEREEIDRRTDKIGVRISSAAVSERSLQLAQVNKQRKVTLEQKREANAKFRDRIAAYDQRMDELADEVIGGVEQINVEVVEYLIARTNTVETVRADTGEVLKSRAATAEDRQSDLPFEGDGDADAQLALARAQRDENGFPEVANDASH